MGHMGGCAAEQPHRLPMYRRALPIDTSHALAVMKSLLTNRSVYNLLRIFPKYALRH